MKVEFLPVGAVKDDETLYAVIATRQDDRWLFVRHRDRDTWEIPGGHREVNESLEEAARRELFEETGAVKYDLHQVCIYSVTRGDKQSYGGLFFAEIIEKGSLPQLEIAENRLSEAFLHPMTYPGIQNLLLEKVALFIAGREQ